MATWTVITNSGGTLQASTEPADMKPAPKVLNRHREGGVARSASISITGRVIVAEIAKTQTAQTLVLRWEYLSATDAATLRNIMSSATPCTVKLYSGATAITCIPAPDAEQKWEPGIGDHWPEKLLDGSAQPTWRTWWRAEITLYRVT
mgnify:CR=1 FL=1